LSCGDHPSLALDTDDAPAHVHACGAADVHPPVQRDRLWAGWRIAGVAVEGIEVGDDRARQQPARTQMRLRPREEGGASCRAAQQLNGLHRHDAQREVAAAQLEGACVAHERAHGHALGALGERAQEDRVALQRGHAMARAREVQCHSSRARADVQDRAGARLGELAPQRQVGTVAAALQVMPDDLARDAGRPLRIAAVLA